MLKSAVGISIYDIQIDAAEASGRPDDAEPSIIFPDQDLLFTGDYRKSGTDLVLTGHEATAIILNYFTRERRPSLLTPEGAGLTGETIESLTEDEQSERYAQSAQAADLPTSRAPIGRVEKISGSVTVLRNGFPVDLRMGDTVAKGDVVQTGSNASVAIRFNDGTVFLLSADARIVLNDMVYAAGSTSNSSLITLVQGVIGFVAGQIAKTGDMKVDTPVATMAIRGTAVHAEISAVSGVTKISVLTEPDGHVGSITLFDRSNPSRVLASVSDPRTATLLTPVAAADPLVTHITKSADDLRGDNDFVRSLFQIFTPQPQRRGSSDSDDELIVPANFQMSIDPPDQNPLNIKFVVPGRPETGLEIAPSIPLLPNPIRGRAVEDGPLARLAALSGFGTSDDGAAGPYVILPAFLPAGVRYIESSRSFTLDPSHPAYQHLGQGETAAIAVNYTLLIDGARIPTSASWTVSGRNDAPIAGDDIIAGASETGRTTLALRANDRDVDGDALRVTGWTAPREGTLHLDASGNLVFDPGKDFEALSAGQTATISFDYTVSDAKGGSDTAHATLTVKGSGTFSAPQATSSAGGTLGFNDQAVALKLATQSATTASTADLDLIINLAPVVQPQMNILYLVDVSGSTFSRFNGAPVGDLNKDEHSNTVLDAEIAGLITLTERIRELGFSPHDVSVTVIPFNGGADPTSDWSPHELAVTAATFNLGGVGDGTIADYLKGLDAGGETNFAEALRAANARLAGLDQGNERNILYFLSDGAGRGSTEGELARLNNDFGAEIVAIGMGAGSNLSQLNAIDNTGGASRLTFPEQIETWVLGTPVKSGEVADIDIFVNGYEIAGIGRDNLVATAKGWSLDLTTGGLNRIVGDQNNVSALVTFTSGEVLRTELTIAGALPRSTDLVL
ncbi:Ig-like domain-containing protein [Microvirga sp. 2YAF29]|uniref:Ig-like domain-containing protein n=1 Tax=Microvirga sp. 2YAF29 TaxID=3233031 RepID=UPI003F99F695